VGEHLTVRINNLDSTCAEAEKITYATSCASQATKPADVAYASSLSRAATFYVAPDLALSSVVATKQWHLQPINARHTIKRCPYEIVRRLKSKEKPITQY
jgi:hypothetical protein